MTGAVGSPVPLDVPLVSETPVTYTPNVVSGTFPADQHTQVWGYVPMGGVMYACGDFLHVKSSNGAITYTRHGLFAFDPNTGALNGFKPTVSGAVETCVASPDHKSLYIGGTFSHVNGHVANHVAKINAATGQLLTGFHASTNALVSELAVVHGVLLLGGDFTRVNGQPRKALATVALDTGATRPYASLNINGEVTANSGPTRVYRFAINPNQTQGVAIGNFTSVNGVRHQGAFRFRLGASAVSLLNWDYQRLHTICGPTGNMPVWSRDVQFSPLGGYFVIAGTGGRDPNGDRDTLCDTAARWETSHFGSNVAPTWVNHTCVDTLHSVAVTSAAVYVQGHQKCVMGPYGTQVPRYGIAALNPTTGRALSWRSDQARQVGGKYLMVTNSAKQPGFPSGLWSGCDCHLEGSVIFRPVP
jgi:hypothetical protein